MAISKRIHKPSFRTTPAAKTTKSKTSELRTSAGAGKRQDAAYAYLYDLNCCCRQIIEILGKIEQEVGVPRRQASYYQVLVEEACALASQDMLEVLDEKEISRSARLGQIRQRLEKQLFA